MRLPNSMAGVGAYPVNNNTQSKSVEEETCDFQHFAIKVVQLPISNVPTHIQMELNTGQPLKYTFWSLRDLTRQNPENLEVEFLPHEKYRP